MDRVIWNSIVTHYEEHYNDKEESVQKAWEHFFVNYFQYNETEVCSQYKVRFGSKERGVSDILIKIDNDNKFCAELKQYHMHNTKRFEEQLISYLERLHVAIGIIVCKEIYVYSFDYSANLRNKTRIAFTIDNPVGIKFINLFRRDNFTMTDTKKFVEDNLCTDTLSARNKASANRSVSNTEKRDSNYSTTKNDGDNISVKDIVSAFDGLLNGYTEVVNKNYVAYQPNGIRRNLFRIRTKSSNFLEFVVVTESPLLIGELKKHFAFTYGNSKTEYYFKVDSKNKFLEYKNLFRSVVEQLISKLEMEYSK